MKFNEMKIDRRTTSALEKMGYTDATEVQEKAIPLILEGKSIVVRSQTGTGKTAAFGIGLIDLIAREKIRALILAPTRELVIQITNELRAIAANHRMSICAIYGGTPMGKQIAQLRRGVDIVIATPGRLLDHAQRQTINLGAISALVLDEADRMLDMGFKPDIDRIFKQLAEPKQVMLFSATLDGTVKKMIGEYMEGPETIEIGAVGKVEKIEEEFIKLKRMEKFDKLKELLGQYSNSRTIVFVTSKWAVEEICSKLNRFGINAKYLHGGKSQTQRERTVREFTQGRFNILIATDVASRGLHIDDISHVINYDQADTSEVHTHRIGRTGRMGNIGKAITFVELDPLPKKQYGKGRRGNRSFGNRNRYDQGYGQRSSHPRSSSHGHSSDGYGSQKESSSKGSFSPSGMYQSRRRRHR